MSFRIFRLGSLVRYAFFPPSPLVIFVAWCLVVCVRDALFDVSAARTSFIICDYRPKPVGGGNRLGNFLVLRFCFVLVASCHLMMMMMMIMRPPLFFFFSPRFQSHPISLKLLILIFHIIYFYQTLPLPPFHYMHMNMNRNPRAAA